MKKHPFTNLIPYVFTRQFQLPASACSLEQQVEFSDFGHRMMGQVGLQNQLEEFKFKACTPQRTSSQGWFSPFGADSKELALFINDHVLLIYREEIRTVPPAEINRLLDKKVNEHLDNGGTVNKKQRDEWKEDIAIELLNHAFSKFKNTAVWIDLEAQRICVDTTSHANADKPLAVLRKSLGTLPIVPMPENSRYMEDILTRWVELDKDKKTELPDCYQLGEAVNLSGIGDDPRKANFKNHNLLDDDVQIHVATGLKVNTLALRFRAHKELKPDEKEPVLLANVGFTLNDKMAIKSIKLDIEPENELDYSDAAAVFSAEFAIITAELSYLLDRLNLDFSAEE